MRLISIGCLWITFRLINKFKKDITANGIVDPMLEWAMNERILSLCPINGASVAAFAAGGLFLLLVSHNPRHYSEQIEKRVTTTLCP